MESKRFSEMLRAAVDGDPDAVEVILLRYIPMINKQSVISGKFDEDLRQYIIMRIIMQIPRFDPEALK